ncbi:amino acid adenylation domain-containing protein [Jatrophihabitans endophyticus]|uniref:Amino acid adenylation domain-containing protein n=1 Tax=Jatrophihabitans endophyticus TaxID=1206085 RepID=A0A1M5CPW6_9ACTN|nr:non-ribosomal peptide synthetase [Jatrophihabitans endophyticus]SHF56751.1 amino acid adenylation domain-containing protein [Jatrophihabitans endophyticus]
MSTKARLARLPLERRARFLGLLARGNGATSTAAGPVARRPGTPVPLSYAQNLLWFVDQLAPGQTAYNQRLPIRLRGPLDVPALQRALQVVVDRHENLRTSLRVVDGVPQQVVADVVTVDLPVLERDPADDDPVAWAAARQAEFGDIPFHLGSTPLWRATVLRIAPDDHLFLFVIHHAVFDAASTNVLVGELSEVYGAQREHRPPRLPEVRLHYGDFALWQRDYLSGERLDRLVRYWRGRLEDVPQLELPTDFPRPAEFTFRGAEARLPVRGRLVEGVRRLAREMGTTPYPVYVAAYAMLLNRYSGQDDLVIGCSTSVRGRLEIEHMMGFFVNMLALRLRVEPDVTFRQLVRHVDHVVREGFAHIDLPFERVVEIAAPERDPSRSPLVQATFLLPDRPQHLTMHGLTIDADQTESTTSKFDMTWQMYEDGDDSSLDVEYATDLFRADTIEQMQRHFVRLLGSGVDDPDRRLGSVDILGTDERRELVERWNGPQRPVPATTVDAWFADVVAQAPDAVAVVCGTTALTYAELDARSTALAVLLRDRFGARAGELVALALPRGVEHVLAVLAVLKAGAAYVEIDRAAPHQRFAAIIADAVPCVVVTTADLTAAFTDLAPVLDVADPVPAATAPLTPSARPDDLAYVLYTSGSTGTPKGVRIEHRNVVNFIVSTQHLFDLTARDRVLAYASYTFDVSVFEMFAALLTGAQLHVALEADRLDLDRLQALLVDAGITVVDLPPSVMALLDPTPMTQLRICFVGGEAFSAELVERWRPGRRFFNGYGPTECTVTMIVYECTDASVQSPPIGLPMANHVAHVLDDAMRLIPYGVPGELVIGGAGLARDYLNDRTLTEQKFRPDPFGTAPDGRLYRTGDLVKRQADGNIVFLGRIDRQIKIRGVRIEPGEVEAALLRLDGVRQAHVTAREDDAGNRTLVAYVSGTATEGDELRSTLAATLPPALVPQHVVTVGETLPLNASGKIDVRALPAPAEAVRVVADTVHPASDTERIIADELVGPALRLDDVDVVRSFFELGGTSLMAAQLINAIRRRFDVPLSVTEFFRNSSVTGLATVVDERRSGQDDELLDLVDTLGAAEVDAVLKGGS